MVFLYIATVRPYERTANIQGGSFIPYFTLGKNTNSEWQNMLDEYYSPPWVHLESNHALITVSKESARKFASSPNELMQKYDEAIEIEEKVSGTSYNTDDIIHAAPKHRHHLIVTV